MSIKNKRYGKVEYLKADGIKAAHCFTTRLGGVSTGIFAYFDFEVPTELPGVDPKILDPRDTYDCACKWEEKAKDLAGRFIKNINKYTTNDAGKALVEAGPKL